MNIPFTYATLIITLNTDITEISHYGSQLKLFLWILFFFILPSLFLIFFKKNFNDKKQKNLKEILKKYSFFFIFILMMLLIIFSNKSNIKEKNLYRDFFKIQGQKLVPINYLYVLINSSKNIFQKQKQSISQNAKKNDKNITFILILGESARSKNFQINGYKKQTTPNLLQINNLISFRRFFSCDTSTVLSTNCLFSHLEKKDFIYPSKFENLLEMLYDVDFDVKWYATQFLLFKYNKKIQNFHIDPNMYKKNYDFAIFDFLNENLKLKKDKSNFIILHHYGSHEPYNLRYSKKFERFKPSCKAEKHIDACTSEEKINSYDNSILATDAFIAKTIEKFKNEENAVILYVSDHGESLGENGQFTHALPYDIAPIEQKHIPMIIWFSDKYLKNFKLNIKKLEKIKNKNLSHDNIFHTILGILKISSPYYNQNLDIINIANKK